MKQSVHSDETRNFLIDRMLNTSQTAEGSVVPPQQRASMRVPVVKRLAIAKQTSFFGGTEFVLVWLEPDEPNINIAQYNILVYGLVDTDTPSLSVSAPQSPATVRLTAELATRVTFVVQTQLTSGLVCPLDIAPSCTGIVSSAGLIAADIPNNSIAINKIQTSTPFNVFTWDAGGNPASTPASALGDYVEGNSNLTTAGAVPFVISSGELTQDAANLFWDNSTNRLGVGTNTPLSTLQTGGSFGAFYQAISTSTAAGNAVTYYADATGGNVDLSLPVAATVDSRVYTLKKTDASGNTVGFLPNGAETIDGAPSLSTTTQYEGWTIQASAGNWYIIGRF
jgi:hypothetical protein